MASSSGISACWPPTNQRIIVATCHAASSASWKTRLAVACRLQRDVDVAALARPVVRPLGHEGRHQAAALRQHLDEGLEQRGLVGGFERLVDA